ncbi:MAG: hypothetical protein AAGA70_00285 [Pseudomonadota bacterium]
MIRTSLACILLATPLAAQDAADFSANSQASSWNLGFEVPARFNATVVDVGCEVAGDCADECGANRQMALLRSVDGVLVYPNKNNQPAFTGAAVDLQPYCGMEIEVDGLMIEDEYIGAVNVYQVQCIRLLDSDEWIFTTTFTEQWAANNPDAGGSGPWFRRDPGILANIAADGYLGIGLSHEEAWDITR